jgi:ER membrane protein SH3
VAPIQSKQIKSKAKPTNPAPATSFFLGILFSLFPYDYPVLWSSFPTPDPHWVTLEAHLRLLHASPPLIPRILHIMIFLGLLGLIMKLYKPSESNMLFDGGSLVLYMAGVIVYIANIVKGLRIVTVGKYGEGLDEVVSNLDRNDEVDLGAYDRDTGASILGREDNLKVLAASNTILALVLVGVLVLQAGQWYAERADEKEKRKFREAHEKERREEREEKKEANAAAGVGRKESKRESKKAK